MKHKRLPKLLKVMRPNLFYYAITLLLVVGLKYHYSVATAAGLDWIIRPTAVLVGWISGLHFEKMPGVGYLNRDLEILIAPACSGVNFLIISTCMGIFSFLHRFSKTTHKVGWLFVGVSVALLVTLSVNALRIVIAIVLYHHHIECGWLTEAQIHRLEGLLIYFLCLTGLYAAMEAGVTKLLDSRTRQVGKFPANRWTNQDDLSLYICLPLLWYVTITILVPVFNPFNRLVWPLFGQNCLVILFGAGLITLIRLGVTRRS